MKMGIIVGNCAVKNLYFAGEVDTRVKKEKNFEWYSHRKVSDGKFYFHRQHIILVYVLGSGTGSLDS